MSMLKCPTRPASPSRRVTSRHGKALFALVGFAVVATVLLLLLLNYLDRFGAGDLPPPNDLPLDRKGEVRHLTNTTLDWTSDRNNGNESSSSWESRLGPQHSSIVEGVELAFDWDGSLPEELWRREIGKGYASVVVSQSGEMILFHRVGDVERIECLNVDDLKPGWAYEYPTQFVQPNHRYTDGPISTPLLVGSRVLSLGIEGKLHCFEIASGELLWSRDLGADYPLVEQAFGIGVSPAVDGNTVFIPIGAPEVAAGIVAIDLERGETLWNACEQPASYSEPQVARIGRHHHLFCLTDLGLLSLHPETGKLRWSIPFRGRVTDSENACSPVVSGNLVAVSAYGMGALVIEIQPDGSYRELWRDSGRPKLDVNYNNMVGWNGFLYGFSATSRRFRCLDMRTGELVTEWRSRMRRGYVFKVGDHFVVFDEHGYLAALGTEEGKLKPMAQTDQPLIDYPCYAAPTILPDRFIVRNEAHVACFRITEK